MGAYGLEYRTVGDKMLPDGVMWRDDYKVGYYEIWVQNSHLRIVKRPKKKPKKQ